MAERGLRIAAGGWSAIVISRWGVEIYRGVVLRRREERK